MTKDEIRRAIGDFLELVEDRNPPDGDRERALQLALDRLALAYHFAEAPPDLVQHDDPAGIDHDLVRRRIATLFPRLGYYNVALDTADHIGQSEMGVGDAIDDLTDIASDLHDVATRWSTTSVNDALREFRFRFETHWGKHLRELQLYLHARTRRLATP